MNERVEFSHRTLRRKHLGHPDPRIPMDHLPLQVRSVHLVTVDHPQRAHGPPPRDTEAQARPARPRRRPAPARASAAPAPAPRSRAAPCAGHTVQLDRREGRPLRHPPFSRAVSRLSRPHPHPPPAPGSRAAQAPPPRGSAPRGRARTPSPRAADAPRAARPAPRSPPPSKSPIMSSRACPGACPSPLRSPQSVPPMASTMITIRPPRRNGRCPWSPKPPRPAPSSPSRARGSNTARTVGATTSCATPRASSTRRAPSPLHHDDPELAPVIAVDRAWRIGQSDPVLERKPRPRPHLHLPALGDLHGEPCGISARAPGASNHALPQIFGEIRAHAAPAAPALSYEGSGTSGSAPATRAIPITGALMPPSSSGLKYSSFRACHP